MTDHTNKEPLSENNDKKKLRPVFKSIAPDERTEKLRKEILNQYDTISSFAKAIDIPITTLTSSLSRGIGSMPVERAILICNKLGIDLETLAPIEETPEPEPQVLYQLPLSKDEEELFFNYRQLSFENKKKVQEIVNDILELQNYRDCNK